MAAPTFSAAVNGLVISATSGSVVNASGGNLAVGTFVIAAIMQDGTGTTATLSSISASLSNLAGTTSAVTAFPAAFYDVGSAAAAKLVCFMCRVNTQIANTVAMFTANSSSGNDMYIGVYAFLNVSTGTTLATVVENGTAGTVNSGAATSTTVADVGVTTLDADRLACNIIGVNDDNALVQFTGQSGGTWVISADFGSATGTDGEIGIQTAPMAAAGTIDGGTYTQASDAWGVAGFALIGTTPPASSIVTRDPFPWLQAVNRSNVY